MTRVGTAGAGPSLMIIDDDFVLAQVLAEALENMSARIWVAHSGAESRAILARHHPDLILLDLLLPDVDGLVLCSEIRAKADVPIIVCSGTPDKREAVLALKLGADDFIRKPFDLYEVEARIEAVLRRTHLPLSSGQSAPPSQLHVGTLTIDTATKRVLVGDTHILLTMTEYRVLTVLAQNAYRIVSRQELARTVWDHADVSASRTIDVHLRRIRMKLQAAPVSPPTIATLRGFGYRILPQRAEDDEPDA